MSEGKQRRKRREKAGRRAEFLAGLYLGLKGYRILNMRYKSHHGEIDIIARKKDVLAIIEVKRRASLAGARDSITQAAQNRITRTAESYYARTAHVQKLSIRFDVIYVTGPYWRLHHEADAWRDY